MKKLLNQKKKQEFPGLEEADEIIEEAKSYSLAIGMSHDRRMWDYIAIDNETGELIETEDLTFYRWCRFKS